MRSTKGNGIRQRKIIHELPQFIEQGVHYSLIGVKAEGPKDYDEKYITKLSSLSGNTVGLNFNTINISSDDLVEHFSITFLFAGDVVSQIIPKVVKEGVKIKPLLLSCLYGRHSHQARRVVSGIKKILMKILKFILIQFR